MNLKLAIFLIIVSIITLSIFNLKFSEQAELPKPLYEQSPTISIFPKDIYPGDPFVVTVTGSSSPVKISFDGKDIQIFNYKNKSRAFVAIPFEEKVLDHAIHVTLKNGLSLVKKISLIPREKIEKPLGIPEKLGGNTKEAGKTLVSNLAKENQIINNIKTATTTLWSNAFSNPLKSIFVTDEYGYNRDTVGYVIVHKGTDLRAEIGTEVVVMNRGIVRIAQLFTVYGNAIVIDHGLGLSTLYMHLSKMNVKVGDIVEVGQVIGLSGKTGYAESPHLHVSVKINGISIDPMKFLNIFDVI